MPRELVHAAAEWLGGPPQYRLALKIGDAPACRDLAWRTPTSSLGGGRLYGATTPPNRSHLLGRGGSARGSDLRRHAADGHGHQEHGEAALDDEHPLRLLEAAADRSAFSLIVTASPTFRSCSAVAPGGVLCGQAEDQGAHAGGDGGSARPGGLGGPVSGDDRQRVPQHRQLPKANRGPHGRHPTAATRSMTRPPRSSAKSPLDPAAVTS
jgi:hypothetical protein